MEKSWLGSATAGGQDRAGLYFEIRRAGEPQNPARWCRGNADRSAARLNIASIEISRPSS